MFEEVRVGRIANQLFQINHLRELKSIYISSNQESGMFIMGIIVMDRWRIISARKSLQKMT
jgi:hypothetical protein